MTELPAVGGNEKLPIEDFEQRFVEHIVKSTSRQIVYGVPLLMYAERAAQVYWEAAEQGRSPEDYAQDDMEFWPTDHTS